MFRRFMDWALGSKFVFGQGKRTLKAIRLIAEGGFSFVYLAVDSSTGQKYAVKKILVQTKEARKAVRWEVSVHRALGDHPNVMPLLDFSFSTAGSSKGGEEALLLFPLYPDGSLYSFLEKLAERGGRNSNHNQKSPPENWILAVFLQVCRAAEQFHSHSPPWAHRDIKPHNVLLDDSEKNPSGPRACLMDFGSVAVARVDVETRKQGLMLQDNASEHCSMAYRAPELWDVQTGTTIDEKTDMWSLGCLLFAMGHHGFSPMECDVSANGRIRNVDCQHSKVLAPFAAPENSQFSAAYWKLVKECLSIDPAARPSIQTVIETVRERLGMKKKVNT